MAKASDAMWTAPATRSDRHRTIAAGCLGTLLSIAFLGIDDRAMGIGPVELELRIAHTVLAVTGTAFLVWRGARASLALCVLAFLAFVTPYLASFSLSEPAAAAAARAGHPWAPFVGHRLVLFGLAVLTPGPFWLGAVLLVAFIAHAAVLWVALDLGEVGAHVPPDDPWASLAYAAMAVILFGLRHHLARLERELARARAEGHAHRSTAELLLSLRDLANTPLQVLAIALAVLRHRHPADEEVLDTGDRAIARLRDLSDLLPDHDATSLSPDPRALHAMRERRARRSGERPRTRSPR